jgi:hypothetical protein
MSDIDALSMEQLKARLREAEEKLERQDAVSMQDEEDLNAYRVRIAELEQDKAMLQGALAAADEQSKRLEPEV